MSKAQKKKTGFENRLAQKGRQNMRESKSTLTSRRRLTASPAAFDVACTSIGICPRLSGTIQK